MDLQLILEPLSPSGPLAVLVLYLLVSIISWSASQSLVMSQASLSYLILYLPSIPHLSSPHPFPKNKVTWIFYKHFICRLLNSLGGDSNSDGEESALFFMGILQPALSYRDFEPRRALYLAYCSAVTILNLLKLLFLTRCILKCFYSQLAPIAMQAVWIQWELSGSRVVCNSLGEGKEQSGLNLWHNWGVGGDQEEKEGKWDHLSAVLFPLGISLKRWTRVRRHSGRHLGDQSTC